MEAITTAIFDWWKRYDEHGKALEKEKRSGRHLTGPIDHFADLKVLRAELQRERTQHKRRYLSIETGECPTSALSVNSHLTSLALSP